MYLEKYDLKGRVAVVTGGGQGIGFACAQALGEAGAKVVVAEMLPDRVDERRRRADGAGHRRRRHAARRHQVGAGRRGRGQGRARARAAPHILVNNAGVAKSDVRAEDTSDEHWRFHMDVNRRRPVLVLPRLRPADAGGRPRLDRQYRLDVGLHRQQAAAAGVLQRVQGRRAPSDQVARLRMGRSAACGSTRWRRPTSRRR